jgi:hypothetical protein
MVTARWSTVVWVAALMVMTPLSMQAQAPKPPEKPAAGAVEVRFADGSVLKMTLLESKVDITTPYGKLSIPVADIQTLDFATRIPEEDQKAVEKAVADLGNADFKTREEAPMPR